MAITPTGQVVLDSIQLFFMYMYSGNLSAGEAAHPLGVGYAGTGCYYERNTSTGETVTRTAKYCYISNDKESLVYPGLVYDTDADYRLNVTLIEGKNVIPVVNSGNGIQFDTTDGWRVLVDGTQAGFSYWALHNDVALIYGNRVPTYNYNPTLNTFTGEPSYIGTDRQNFFALGSNSEKPLVLVTNSPVTLPQNTTQVILPFTPTSTEPYDILAPKVLTYIQDSYPELEIDSLPDFETVSGTTETETETEPTEPETSACGCKIDYDEILSEDELESILTQETFQLATLAETETDIYSPETLPAQIDNLPAELVVTSNSVVDYGSQMISELGLTPVYAPLMVFSLICYILRGCN